MRFYTVSVTARDGAASAGYKYDGVACYVFSHPTGEHFYTTSATERDNADDPAAGSYQSEGTACYVYDTQIPGTVPFYRLVSSPDKVAMPFYQVYSAQNGDYFYTTSAAEEHDRFGDFVRIAQPSQRDAGHG
jgi:hypothetical protein